MAASLVAHRATDRKKYKITVYSRRKLPECLIKCQFKQNHSSSIQLQIDFSVNCQPGSRDLHEPNCSEARKAQTRSHTVQKTPAAHGNRFLHSTY